MRLEGRVAKLESQGGGQLVVMWRHVNETDETARARWRAENPGKSLEAAPLVVMLLRFADGGLQ